MCHLISNIHAREILDSRGNPTVEVILETKDGVVARAAVPAGTSTGSHEAYELRDGDKSRFAGLGVLKAVNNVNTEIKKALLEVDVTDQKALDNRLLELDGTNDKVRLGGNALLGVSLAAARAGAEVYGLPLYRYLRQAYSLTNAPYNLPLPMMNVLNGGRHADNKLNVQEFLIIPRVLVNGHPKASECLRVGAEVFHTLGELLSKQGLAVGVGSEGGYAPHIDSTEKALGLLVKGIEAAGYTPGQEVSLGLDVAADEFCSGDIYKFEGGTLAAAQMITMYRAWATRFPLVSLEDGLAQDDFQGWRSLTQSLGDKLLIIGDDLFATNSKRLQTGFTEQAANSILIKPNQVGTLSETMATVKLAQEHSYSVVVSHRSGETLDTFIVDLAVAVGAPYLKAGSACRGERVAKYNRLMEIEEELAVGND